MADDHTTPRPDLTHEREIAHVASQIVEFAREYADFGGYCVEADALLERYDALCGVAHKPNTGSGLYT